MKKNILMGAIAALSIASASAETVYLTGATAFRQSVNKALIADYGSSLAASDKPSGDMAASALLFTNINVNGSVIDLSVKWSGSEAGIRTVASPAGNPVTDTFYDAALVKAMTGLPKYSFTLASGNRIATRGDLCFSDTWQQVSNFKGKNKDTRTYVDLNNSGCGLKVGVVPFTFMANKDCGIDNISVNTAFQLAKAGRVPASLLTGNTNDVSGGAWWTGRDPYSGTRVTALQVTKVGYNTLQKNYKPTVGTGGNAGRITSIGGYSAVSAASGQGNAITAAMNGESSGSTLAAYMTNRITASFGGDATIIGVGTTNILISYSTVADVLTHYTNGLVPLKFEGVHGRFGLTNEYATAGTNNVLDSGYTNIITGKYPFWAYEHLLWDPNRSSASISNVVTFLTNSLMGVPSTNAEFAPNIAMNEMLVYRESDGGPIKWSTNAVDFQ